MFRIDVCDGLSFRTSPGLFRFRENDARPTRVRVFVDGQDSSQIPNASEAGSQPSPV